MLMGALSLVMVRLAGDLDELLAQVHLDRPVDDRDEEHEARALDLVAARSGRAGRRPSGRTR